MNVLVEANDEQFTNSNVTETNMTICDNCAVTVRENTRSRVLCVLVYFTITVK